MQWPWVWSKTGRRLLLESCRTRQPGTRLLVDTTPSIQSSFLTPCTVWRAIWTRRLSQHRVRVRVGLDGAVAAVEDFPAEASGEAAEALSNPLNTLSFREAQR